MSEARYSVGRFDVTTGDVTGFVSAEILTWREAKKICREARADGVTILRICAPGFQGGTAQPAR